MSTWDVVTTVKLLFRLNEKTYQNQPFPSEQLLGFSKSATVQVQAKSTQEGVKVMPAAFCGT